MTTAAYLTDRDIARRLGISRSTVWRWVASGNLPKPMRIGPRKVRWPNDVLEKLVAAHD